MHHVGELLTLDWFKFLKKYFKNYKFEPVYRPCRVFCYISMSGFKGYKSPLNTGINTQTVPRGLTKTNHFGYRQYGAKF